MPLKDVWEMVFDTVDPIQIKVMRNLNLQYSRNEPLGVSGHMFDLSTISKQTAC